MSPQPQQDLSGHRLLELGRPLASGRTAEIYPWDDGRILKLYRAGSARSEALRELVVNRRVTDAGIPAPRVFEGDAADGLIEVGDRVGILFERVDGPSMLADLATHPWRLTHHARTLAELHARMHDHEVTGAQLDDQKARLAKAISASARMTPEIDAASVVRILDKLPGGNRVCHGDVHPDNLVLVGGGSGAKAVALDWENATQGDPAADVARTVLILMLASGTPESSLWERVLARVFGRCFLRVYLSAYLRRSRCGVTRTAIDAWLPVQAAARLAEQIPGERTSLLKLIADRDHIAG